MYVVCVYIFVRMAGNKAINSKQKKKIFIFHPFYPRQIILFSARRRRFFVLQGLWYNNMKINER